MTPLSLEIERLLTPISAENPAGVNALYIPEWTEMKTARLETLPGTYGGGEEEQKSAEWDKLFDIASSALETKSKDIRLSTAIIEAGLKTHGIAALGPGLSLLGSLIDRYWTMGLFPSEDNGDHDARANAIESVSSAAPQALVQSPITQREDSGDNALLRHYQASLNNGDAGNLEEAFRKTPLPAYETLQAQTGAAQAALNSLAAVIGSRFKPLEAPNLGPLREAMQEFSDAVEALTQRKKKEAGTTSSPPPKPANAPSTPGQVPPQANAGVGTPAFGASWDAAEQLIQSGNVTAGLAELTRLSSLEHGRAQFLRKLRLAEFCVQSKRDKLGRAILEELAKEITARNLITWESGELIGRVWGRLYKINKSAETGSERETRASELFDQLCRLDPWQAMQWDE